LLLQLAHPWVAEGIAQHSTTLSDPIGRFHRTFDVMFTLVFGTVDQALAAARRLHRRHSAVQGRMSAAVGPFAAGSPYFANEIATLSWVHATLVDTALMVHELACPGLRPEDRERYYQESRLLAGMFGIAPEDQPPDWSAFTAYAEATWHSPAITISPLARQIAEKVLSGAGSWLRSPGWYRAVTTHLLPEPVRAGFGLPYGAQERRTAERALRWIERVYPAVPRTLRFVGPYQEAAGRIAGRASPSLTTRMLNRAWIGRGTMPEP
jgi:uncharacterized protein (DUF2236 family)